MDNFNIFININSSSVVCKYKFIKSKNFNGYINSYFKHSNVQLQFYNYKKNINRKPECSYCKKRHNGLCRYKVKDYSNNLLNEFHHPNIPQCPLYRAAVKEEIDRILFDSSSSEVDIQKCPKNQQLEKKMAVLSIKEESIENKLADLSLNGQ